MTSITRLRFRNRRRLTFRRVHWRHETTRREQISNGRDNAFEHRCPAERIATGNPHRALNRSVAAALRMRGGYAEGSRYHRLELEYVGDIVNKTEWLSPMQESDCRGISRRQYRSLTQSVQTGGSRGKRAVRNVCLLPLRWIIPATLPFDPMDRSQLLVHLSYARTLDSAQLIDRTTSGRFFTEAHTVHG